MPPGNILEWFLFNAPLTGIVLIVIWVLLRRSDKVLRDVIENHRTDANKQNERYLALMEKTIKLLERHDLWLYDNKKTLERIEQKLK